MKNLLYLLLFLIFGNCEQSHDDYNIAYELCFINLSPENYFINDKDAEIALNKILSVIGAPKNFILQPCTNINNALATTHKGINYILYDKNFMNTIANNSNSWSNLFILAHEVGHHINGHTIDALLEARDLVEPLSLAERRQQELESDEFAGFILEKMGATLSETSSAINFLASNEDDTYSTHPNKTKRLKAIKTGYSKSTNKEALSYENRTNELRDDAYFYRALYKCHLKDFHGAI